MAKFMLLIHGDEARWNAMTPAEWAAHGAAHQAFHDAAGARVLGGEQLEASSTATTVRSGSDTQLITDGPFLETKEVIGGFYLVEAADLDEVLKLVALLPETHAAHSGVEIRPVVTRG